MKKLCFLLLSFNFLMMHAQESKNVKIDPNNKDAKEKFQKAFPPKPPVHNTNNTPTHKASGPKSDTQKGSKAKPFSYKGIFTLNFDDKNKQGHYNTGKMQYALDSTQAAIIPTFANLKEISSLKAILDMDEKEITMLTTDVKGKKTGILMKFPKPILKQAADTKNTVKPLIKKTGETRVIQGYKCERVLISMPDTTKIDAWVTNEISLNMAELLSMANSGFKGKSPFGNTNLDELKGTALETVINRKDGGVMKLTITDIRKGKPDAVFFNTDGYKINDVRGLPMFGGQ